jgi:hypothetical protein
MPTIDDMLRQFREAAITYAEFACRDPKKANAASAVVQECYKILKLSKEGRDGLISLMSDADAGVRCTAAARSLAWDPERARRILEEVRDADGPGAFEAKWTLIEYDKGRLTFDY